MKDFVLPITCKARDKLFRYYALCASPILGTLGIIFFPTSEAAKVGIQFAGVLILTTHWAFFLAMVLIWVIENSDKLPKIRCKCDDDK